MSEFQSNVRYELYIGLKDKNTYEEYFSSDQFVKLLSGYLSVQGIPFSVSLLTGGYAHNLGYTTESSVVVTLIGAQEEQVFRLAEELKRAVNTDTALITREYNDVAYV